MYYPYFRGKQYELVTIREKAATFAANKFTPIIEPVRELSTGLTRALQELQNEKARCVLIINPQDGRYSKSQSELAPVVSATIESFPNAICGIFITPEMTTADVVAICDQCKVGEKALIHSGFRHGKELAAALADRPEITTSIFKQSDNKLYRKHFANHANRILLGNGFIRRNNREYPLTEPFSDLHVTYVMDGMTGFGDYLIVGDEYTEGGGPAYAVAIHMTYIDSDLDDEMHIFHFVSTDTDSQANPGGKFAQAVKKLVEEADRPGTKLAQTEAIDEFRELHKSGHYPGLGYVKKLSMAHHIDTLAAFLSKQA